LFDISYFCQSGDRYSNVPPNLHTSQQLPRSKQRKRDLLLAKEGTAAL